MKKTKNFVDPRTKLFLLLTMNILLLSMGTGPKLSILRFSAGFFPFVMLMIGEKYRFALSYLGVYLGSYATNVWILPELTGFWQMLMGFLGSVGTRFVPGGMMGVYFLTTTRVNEFGAAMAKMHVSQKIIIPLSVMFRLFPTVKEESASISAAMRMRKLGARYFWRRPVEVLEYRLVPLLMSVVNIGEDLSASALTRCLGKEKTRTSISPGGFGRLDVVLFLTGGLLILGYILAAGGLWV